MRVITWGLATQKGVRYNPTYPFEEMQAYLDFISRYKLVKFQRVANYNDARIKFLNMPVAVMQTDISKFTCKISSSFNFGRNSYWCARATCHEFMHMAGGKNHIANPHVMAPDGGSVGNFTEADYGYLGVYKDKTTLRPWHEPNAMRDAFAPKVKAFGSVAMPEGFRCSCVDKRRKVYGSAEMEVP